MTKVVLISLHHLSARDLARTALTCTELRRAVSLLNAARCADVSGGLEELQVPVQSSQDGREAYPEGFQYTRDNVLPPDVQPVGLGGGCASSRCGDGSCASDCPCNTTGNRRQYDDDGRLIALLDAASRGRVGLPLYECGPACPCPGDCRNRRSQQGLQAEVVLRKDPRKGWSVVAARAISRGAFVCQYAGELLSTPQARQRIAEYDSLPAGTTGHALLVVREWLPSGRACLRINVDATRVGNVARFVNHSCGGGNLELAVVRRAGSPVPHVAMFARRDIALGEELSFMYGEAASDATEGARAGGRPCHCGAAACPGVLPAEQL